jgi:hypothetical protein
MADICPFCPSCRASEHPRNPAMYQFEAYGYEVTIEPYFEPGQWIASIDGMYESYENWVLHPSEEDAIVESLKMVQGQPRVL